MLIIENWFGRLGNNILQILRAVHYGIINNHDKIVFPPHSLLTAREILLMTNSKVNASIVRGTFYYLKKQYGIVDPEPYIMKKYFMQYVDSIFTIKDDIDLKDHNDVYIHIRGGDIFNRNPHRAYVQPPLSYYTKIFQLYDNKILICEDNRNPCVSKLKQNPKVYEKSGSLINDLTILRNATNVVIGFGTFGLLVYFMNKKLQNLYMPKYMKDTFVHGDNWGDDITVNIIDLPSYIPVGEWKNSPEQIKMMLTYK